MEGYIEGNFLVDWKITQAFNSLEPIILLSLPFFISGGSAFQLEIFANTTN